MNVLTPIFVSEPPFHTRIPVRCFTCKKFEVCNLRTDYLRTATLIQNIIGNPQEDYAMTSQGGKRIENDKDYFPAEIQINNLQGNFVAAYWGNINHIEFFYEVGGYHVKFIADWDKPNKKFVIPTGKELYYHADFKLSSTDETSIAAKLAEWRTEALEKDKEDKGTVINTTYFSPRIECDFYEWEKGLTEDEGIRRIIARYPNGVPFGDGTYYHLATFHYEPTGIPCYHPENGRVAFAPMPYFVCPPPPKKCKPKPIKRGDLHE